MSELAARHLVQQGAGTILVTNRTQARAERMAEAFKGKVIPYEAMYDAAVDADIVISSTGAPHPIFRKEHGQRFMQRRRNRPMFFIDIAVPRDVDAAMGKLEGIFVYDIDDLQAVAAAHMAERSREAGDAESLIAGEVERFHQKQRAVNAAPVIVALQKHAEEMRRAELKRLQSRLEGLTAEQLAAIEALTRGLVNKLLHPPMQAFKQAARENNQVRIDALCDAWHLEVDGSTVVDRESFTSASTSVPTIDSAMAKAREPNEESVGKQVSPSGVETHQL
jgi:glutamyl-tRNA reductase